MLDPQEQAQMLKQFARQCEMVAATLEVTERDSGYGENPARCIGERGALVDQMRGLRVAILNQFVG